MLGERKVGVVVLVKLYNCLYGMNLYKKYFASEEIEQKAMESVLRIYLEAHAKGNIIGAIDINQIQLDTETGEVVFPSSESIEKMKRSVDTLKFLPPEVIQGQAEWNRDADLFCMALILFSIRYYGHPYDGLLVCDAPIVERERAERIYGHPIFLFDSKDTSNAGNSYLCGRTAMRWERESNQRLKDYFMQVFIFGVNYDSIRLSAEYVLRLIGSVSTYNGNRTLEWNGRRIALLEGVEIYERDINPSCEENRKIGVVLRSKKNQEVLALGNTSDDTWSVYLPDSKEIMVSPKGVAPIVLGATISICEYLVNII